MFSEIFKNTFFVENLRTAASEKKKQRMNYRFNINGVTENLSNYLPEKCNKNHSNKSLQSFYKIAILKNFAKFPRKHLC